MTIFLNIFLQLLLLVGQLGNQISGFVPEKWRPVVLAALGLVQAAAAAAAHLYNPDGTPAEQKWGNK